MNPNSQIDLTYFVTFGYVLLLAIPATGILPRPTNPCPEMLFEAETGNKWRPTEPREEDKPLVSCEYYETDSSKNYSSIQSPEKKKRKESAVCHFDSSGALSVDDEEDPTRAVRELFVFCCAFCFFI
jgi:hypothetical protein